MRIATRRPKQLIENVPEYLFIGQLPRLAVLSLIAFGAAACQPGASTASASSETAADGATALASAAGSITDSDNNSDNDSGEITAAEGMSMFDSDEKKASYAMGYGITRQITGQFGDVVDHEAFVAGARAQLEGRESEVSQQDAQKALTALSDAQEAQQALVASSTAKEGAKFLADNAEKEGVVTTPSGLQYLVLTEGSGPKPTATETVRTHYEGKLLDGEVFDSSLARGEPAVFPLNGVIPGWTEALQLMSPGSKYRLFIPPELAYGNRGTGPIPPQSTLIFEVELLEILGGDAS